MNSFKLSVSCSTQLNIALLIISSFSLIELTKHDLALITYVEPESDS